jgi:hypothetical protein
LTAVFLFVVFFTGRRDDLFRVICLPLARFNSNSSVTGTPNSRRRYSGRPRGSSPLLAFRQLKKSPGLSAGPSEAAPDTPGSASLSEIVGSPYARLLSEVSGPRGGRQLASPSTGTNVTRPSGSGTGMISCPCPHQETTLQTS